MQPIFQLVANVSPHKCSVSTICLNKKRRKNVNLKSLLNLTVNGNKLVISKQSKNKIEKYINWIIAQAKRKQTFCNIENKVVWFRVNFITLTLPAPQKHTDQVLTKCCLNQLLTEMRKLNKNLHYFWRAEKQGNGNIHYHILTDTYYHHKLLRDDWNRIINKLGYVDDYKRGMENLSFNQWYVRYSPDGKKNKKTARSVFHRQKSIGFSSPNSTDVHAIKNLKNVAAYVAKYCTKEEKNKPVEGRRYGCDSNTRQNSELKIYEGDKAFDQLRSIVLAKSDFTFNHEYGAVFWGRYHSALINNKQSIGYEYRAQLNRFHGPIQKLPKINEGSV